MNPAIRLIALGSEKPGNANLIGQPKAEYVGEPQARAEQHAYEHVDRFLIDDESTVPNHPITLKQAAKIHSGDVSGGDEHRPEMKQAPPSRNDERSGYGDPVMAETSHDLGQILLLMDGKDHSVKKMPHPRQQVLNHPRGFRLIVLYGTA